MKKLFAALLTISLLTGCTSFEQSTTVAALSTITAATNLTYYYDSGEAVEFIDNAPLSDMEATQILEALDQADRSRERLHGYKNHPEKILSDLPKIAFEYAKIKSAYLSVRSIVLNHKFDYTQPEWDTFVRFDGAASALDASFSQLVDAAEANAALLTALRLADTALKMAAVL